VLPHELTNQPTNQPTHPPTSYSDIQEIPRLLWNPKIHCRVHESPSLLPVLSQKKVKVKLPLRIATHNAMKTYWGVGVELHLLTSAPDVSGQLHTPAAIPSGEEPPHTHWIGGWVGGGEEKKNPIIALIGNRAPVVQPAALAPYFLSYPDSWTRLIQLHFPLSKSFQRIRPSLRPCNVS
jgi:hypothetical protein